MLKPPPKPPKPGRGNVAYLGDDAASHGQATEFKQLKHYKLPMRSTYLPEWKARLREAGYPEDVVVFDFENYFDSDYNMRKDEWSTIEYVMDPKFENLGVSTLEMNQPFDDYVNRTRWWNGEKGVQEAFDHLRREYGDNLEGCTVVAQNAGYDGAILSFRMGIVPPRFIDVLGLARHWNARTKNDLDTLAKRWGLPVKGDTSRFKEWTNRNRFKRQKGRKKGPKKPVQLPKITAEGVRELAGYANNDVMREWELFTILLPLMSNHRSELRCMQHTLELFWRPQLEVDPEKGAELTAGMEQEIEKALPEGVERSEISGDTRFEDLLSTALTWAGDEPGNYHKPAKNKLGYKLATAKDDPEREELENHEDDFVRALMAAKGAVSSWPNHIKRVNRIIRQAQAAGGLLPVPLKYHGGHTGRWAGGEKINLQNLGSKSHPLINAIRQLLLAPDGYELVIADASQIEARVLAWIAGEWPLVEAFERNEGIYANFASKVLGYKVRKPKKNPDGSYRGIEAVEKRHEWGRNSIGKIGILGCGYGMGPGDRKTREVKPMFAQAGVEWGLACLLVETYRNENPAITQFWKDIEAAFKYTLKYGKPCRMPRGLSFHQTDQCDVIITLPNGREVKYHTVRVTRGDRGEDLEWWNDQEKHWTRIWGGHLTENVVQAMSRDILWESIWTLEEEGHHTALHVHDEVIIITPEGTGDKVLERATEVLSTRPTWAPECPLAAEGAVSKRYGGH
jgi:DNA polymerase